MIIASFNCERDSVLSLSLLSFSSNDIHNFIIIISCFLLLLFIFCQSEINCASDIMMIIIIIMCFCHLLFFVFLTLWSW